MPLLRPEAPAKKKAAIHAEVKRSKFAAWQHGRTWLSRPMTRLTLQQGDGSHCLARRRRPDAGADEEDVKPRPPQHAAPAPPVKPKPPPHPQTAPFRATLPRHGRSRLHRGASSPRHGRSRETQITLARHTSAPVKPQPPPHPQTAPFQATLPRQGRAHETQTTPACRTSAPSETQTTLACSTSAPSETPTTPASTNCPISSHTAETGAGPVTPRRKQPQARAAP